MNKNERLEFKTLLMVMGAIIAAVIGGIFSGIIPAIISTIDFENEGLELVDVNVISEKEEIEKFYERLFSIDQEMMGYVQNSFDKYAGYYKGYWYFPIIEFKFRNTSDKPHIINSIDFEFIKKITKNHKEEYSSIPFSTPYHVIIDTNSDVSSTQIDVSESVDPKSTRRVLVIIAAKFSGYKTFLNYNMNLVINYNINEKFYVRNKDLIVIPPLNMSENEKLHDPFIFE